MLSSEFWFVVRGSDGRGHEPPIPHAEPRTQNRHPANPAPGTENRGSLVRAAVIVLAAAVVYANSLSAPFIFDDEVAIVANPAIRSLSGAWSQPPNTPLAGRPVAGLTFALNFAANEVDAAAYRATNIAIHIACALLLFGLVRRTLALSHLRARFGGAASDLAFADRASLGRASADDGCGHLHHPAHRIVDGAVLPDHPVREPARPSRIGCARWTIHDPVAGRGRCRVRFRHGREGIDGHSTRGRRAVRSRLPVRFVSRGHRGSLAALRRPRAHVAGARISARYNPARRLCRLWNRSQRVDLLVEPVRDDRAVSAARRVAERSRDQLRTARSVRAGAMFFRTQRSWWRFCC